MPSDIYNSIVDSLDGQLTLPSDDLATAKAKMEALHGHPIAADTDAQWLELMGVPCAIVTASGVAQPQRHLLYFRGGAFIAAGGDGFLFYAEMLSQQLDATVVMVDYRVAPEHPFPAALDDCCNAYQGLLKRGVPATACGFIGDSCGGGLVLTSLLRLRDMSKEDRQIEMPAAAVSLCGWFDMASTNENHDPLYHQRYCHNRGRDYAGAIDLTDPLISPVYAQFHQLPPLLLQAGGVDPTATQATTIHQNACQAGITTLELDITPQMLHGFQGLANLGVPESIDALKRVKLFLDRQLNVEIQAKPSLI